MNFSSRDKPGRTILPVHPLGEHEREHHCFAPIGIYQDNAVAGEEGDLR